MKRLLSCLVAAMLIAPVVRAQTTIVADVRAAIAKNDLKGGDELLAKFRQANGTTPDALEALVVARPRCARRRRQRSRRALLAGYSPARGGHVADPSAREDPHLQTALGAAIETEGKAMAAAGQRASGVIFLRNSSIATAPRRFAGAFKRTSTCSASKVNPRRR